MEAQKMVAHSQVPFSMIPSLLTNSREQGRDEHMLRGPWTDWVWCPSSMENPGACVVSLLLSFPQITSPPGLLQFIPPWGHLKASCQHPCPSLGPPKTNMSALGVQKHPDLANGRKKMLGLDPRLAIREHLRICSCDA